MDRLFLDANVLFSAAYRGEAGVSRLWDRPDVVLLTSAFAIDEARRNLTDDAQLERLRTLLGAVEVVPSGTLAPDVRGDIQLPEKDWPILAGALAARATHLITGDIRDFGRFFGKVVMGILVLPPAVYLRGEVP